MKTGNCRVRVKDIKSGKTIYVAHPVYGIEKHTLIGRPYNSQFTNSLFANTTKMFCGKPEMFSLCDAGITAGSGYNWRRSFFKLKHAEDWATRMKSDPKFIAWLEWHEEQNRQMFEMFPFEIGY